MTGAVREHAHPHDHVPGHGHAEENPYAGQGAVLLDIGDDVGAVVVTMPAAMVGTEIEIRPTGRRRGEGHHPHAAVVSRPTPVAPVPSLVFGDVREGNYDLCLKESDDVVLTSVVTAGRVTALTWPG